VRLELDQELKKLERAANIVISDPEVMRGTPVYPLIGRKSASHLFMFKPFPAVGILLLARGQSKNRFVQLEAPVAFRSTVKLLIDECLHTSLVELAHAAGHVAHHVNHPGPHLSLPKTSSAAVRCLPE